MPTMVMSQPPKVSGDTSLRKRQKTKNDNIMAISYMYVGTPKKKFMFYVRERLVYRSNVEVTFEEVFNYLSNITNDESITLHYSVNGLYVPITTTGQLHTFLRHVHNDPAVFLYVENQDYVWNVTPNDNSHKMEKRVPAGGAAPTDEDGDLYDSMEDEDEEAGDGNGEESSQNDDDGSKQHNELEEETKLTSPLTSNKAPIVFAEKIPIKEAFEPKPRPMTQTKSQSTVEKQQSGSKCCGHSEGTQPPSLKKNQPQSNPGKEVRLPDKNWTAKQAYNEIKTMLSVAHAKGKMFAAPGEIAERLVLNIWNPDFPLDRQVYNDTVALLQNSVSMGVLCYYHRLLHKEDPTKDNSAGSIEKLPLRDSMPAHDPEFLAEFVEGAIIAARNILESVQNLAHLQNEFDYFSKMKKVLSERANGQDQLPSIHELGDHLKTAVTSAHYGFNILKPLFPTGCECKDAIRIVTLELQKLLCVINNSKQKTCSPQWIQETKMFIVESSNKIVQRFTEKECPEHKTIEHALQCSEESKWKKDVHHGYDEWNKLSRENRPMVPETCYEVELQPPAPFSLKLDGVVGETTVVSSAKSSGGVRRDATPAPTSKNSNSVPQSSTNVDKTITAMKNMSTKDKEEVKKSDQTVPKQATNTPAAAKPASTTTNVSATTTSTGEAAGGGAAIISKKMSPELQGLVDKMYKSVPTQHNYVYPAQPKPGAILIPTGGLARCRCSKNCPEFLMEPAYEYMERFNEPRQTVWEKTKQKRFKKN